MNRLMGKKQREEYVRTYQFKNLNDLNNYNLEVKIGQGTFGEVWKAHSRESPKKYVAVKRIMMENESQGFPITALREIKILQLLRHENIVNLIEVCRSTGSTTGKRPAYNRTVFHLVFDFCEHDLAGLLSNIEVKFLLSEIKKIMHMMLNGLYYIHSNKILHRDLKAANILITKSGILKLADFGLSRPFSVPKKGEANEYTNKVVTLWYRPPELLLGDQNYGPPIDLWGAGCIMAELWTRSPILQGGTEQKQIALIINLCGSITRQNYPGAERLKLYNHMMLKKGEPRKVKQRLSAILKDPHAIDLIDKLLTLDPNKRIDADNALEHDFFWTDPMPSDLTRIMSMCDRSLFDLHVTSTQRQMIRQQAPGAHKNFSAVTRPNHADTEYKERIW